MYAAGQPMSSGVTRNLVAAAGLALGGVIPLGALAAAASLPSGRRSTGRVAIALWLGVLAAVAVTVVLSLRQQDGYIPLLGAAKDLALVDKPEDRRFAAGLEDLGHGLFPWAPLAVAGALWGRGDRFPALWLGLSVTVASGVGLVYGPGPLPVTVPAALCALGGVRFVLDPRTDRRARRLVLAVVVLGMLVIGKDARATPSRVTVPLVDLEREDAFPDAASTVTMGTGGR